MTTTIESLIERASIGDGAALATLLQEFEPKLLEYVRRRLPRAVGTLAAPEDIVQDTCYEACRMIKGFVSQGGNSFYRWLVRIANLRIKATIQKYRSRRMQAVSTSASDESSVLNALEQLVVYRRTPSGSAVAHEFISAIERSLDRLTPSYREVITHRFINGLSVDETAERMGKASDQVYVLSSRALSALREQLQSASRYL
jgi:RNA polymerase sigma-70 factor, ECF subfamily